MATLRRTTDLATAAWLAVIAGCIHDCHEGAHGADPTWCAANTVSCYTLCREARAAAADAGTADAGAHGGDAATHD
ncbi:MAG: hypothetical protein R3A52_28245 [Polyangiales bacterium]